LQSAVAADPALGDQVRETLLDLLPAVAASLAAPERGEDTDWDALGASADEIRAVALKGLNRRLKTIGVNLCGRHL
jgi:hypothetical protein